MKLARELSSAEAKKVQSFILFGGSFTTLAMWTKLEDPINLPKMFVLSLFAAVVLGLSIPALLSARKLSSGSQKLALGLVAIFVIGLTVSTFATDVKYTAIFGAYHRNNGFLSYLAMTVLLLASFLVFNFKGADRYFRCLAGTGLILTFYGILQGAGMDPVGWKIEYNPYITTLGNPNFTSGLLGLSGVAIFYLVLESPDRKRQVLYFLGLICDLYILRESGSIQGLLGFSLGAIVLTVTKLWVVDKRYGLVGLISCAITSVPVALATFNIGPLTEKLYQSTLKNRLDYWNAAIGMFKEHPALGVGIDRFGEYYRQYAVQNQVVPGQVTDNAHSVYFQLLATGGLITFLPYILLVIFITARGIFGLLELSGRDKIRLGGVFGLWISGALINLVTIDNLGVGVWNWIAGGLVLALSGQTKNETIKANLEKKQSNSSLTSSVSDFTAPQAIAGLMFGVCLFLMIPTLNSSSRINDLNSNLPAITSQEFNDNLARSYKGSETNPQYLILLSNLTLRVGLTDLAIKIVNRINEIDPRSYYGTYFSAVVYENLGKPAEAIPFREKLRSIDPWNNGSLIELIKDYLALGNKDSAISIYKLIENNYPGSQSALDAKALFEN